MRAIYKKGLLLCLSLLMAFMSLIPARSAFAAPNQTTIIILDKKAPYDIGEKVKVTVGVSSTDGSYLKEAYCGFGYNGATMKLLTETETEDHFRVSAATPQKWLYYDMEFEMTANGKMYFIAGAYSGNGVIEAIKADGNHISLPRASVMYNIGTGMYTKVSDCNLKSLEVRDQNGNLIEFNRSFDKNIIDYTATVAPSVTALDIRAASENPDDKVFIPDAEIKAGENEKVISVRASDGAEKHYNLKITKPAVSAECEDIEITKNTGDILEYEFSKDNLKYDLTVPNDCDYVNFNVVTSDEAVQYDIPDGKLETGYNIKKVRLYTDGDEKTYEYFIYREPSELTLTSLVIEGSDELTLKLDKEFNPEIYKYSAEVTPDVRKVKFIYTLANPEDKVKEENNEYELGFGDNIYTVTVTDGINEKVYTIKITRPEYEKVEEDPVDDGPYRNPYDFTYFKKTNLTFLIGGAAAILLIIALSNVYKARTAEKDYKNSEEAEIDDLNEQRKSRLKKMAKERKKQNKKK